MNNKLLEDIFNSGAESFQKKVLEQITLLEARLYEDSDQTTPKELLWEIIGTIERLKI